MHDDEHSIIIGRTKKWILDVIIGCGFCPFAAKEIKKNTVHFEVLNTASRQGVLEKVIKMAYFLDNDKSTATALLILPDGFHHFNTYLELVELAEKLLKKEKYEGTYQLASFHPYYIFAGSNQNDPANYTNRSPYPMLHFLREDSITSAVNTYPEIDKIPARNIAFSQKKGIAYMQQMFNGIMEHNGL